LTFVAHLEHHLARTQAALALPNLAGWVLQALVRIDVDSGAAEQVRVADVHQRAGVLSWQALVDLALGEGASVEDLEEAVVHLASWELLQVVGRLPGDPVVPGAAALRMTHHGRVCLGLAPAARLQLELPSYEARPWLFLHGTSREALVIEAQSVVGDVAFEATPSPALVGDIEQVCGRIAEMVCTRGGAVLDGFWIRENPSAEAFLREVVRRTRNAAAPRVLIVKDPAALRDVMIGTGADTRWVEPRIHTRRGENVLDERITAMLEEHPDRTPADICGVPDSEIADPKRVDTAMGDLLLPAEVRVQLEQALLHARFRLHEASHAHHVPGSGKGYRLLLSGLPGTGKSLTAEALATTLGRPLIKLDLSSVLSKWLGETEKLLAQVFDVAEVADAVLVLDEAEALFRQREGGQSGTGALATGVAYLLTRLDRFQGVLVATTNRSRDMDEAFFRRFDDFIILPIPDRDTRRSLWTRMLPLDGDKDSVDIEFLAKKFPISGGLIRGASIRAAAWADGLERPLSTPIVLASLSRELGKSDRSTAEVMVEPYRDEVKALLGKDGSNRLMKR